MHKIADRRTGTRRIYVTHAKIEILRFSSMPELALEGWDPNRVDGDAYQTERAARLFEALGVSLDDEEYQLAEHTDGRWALIGLTESCHKFAVEVQS